jgi:hypothetical protein
MQFRAGEEWAITNLILDGGGGAAWLKEFYGAML